MACSFVHCMNKCRMSHNVEWEVSFVNAIAHTLLRCCFVDVLNPLIILSCCSSHGRVSYGVGSDRSVLWDVNKGSVSLSIDCDKIGSTGASCAIRSHAVDS